MNCHDLRIQLCLQTLGQKGCGWLGAITHIYVRNIAIHPIPGFIPFQKLQLSFYVHFNQSKKRHSSIAVILEDDKVPNFIKLLFYHTQCIPKRFIMPRCSIVAKKVQLHKRCYCPADVFHLKFTGL